MGWGKATELRRARIPWAGEPAPTGGGGLAARGLAALADAGGSGGAVEGAVAVKRGGQWFRGRQDDGQERAIVNPNIGSRRRELAGLEDPRAALLTLLALR